MLSLLSSWSLELKTIINLVDQGHQWKFHGGIHPPSRKERTKTLAISTIEMPQQLFLSLSQHIGQPAVPVVAIGDTVQKGQLLAKQDGFISAAVIAPTSGTISDICQYSNCHISGIETQTIVLTPDHLNTWRTKLPLTLTSDHQQILERIKLSGITGLGGAGFPAAVKLATKAAIEFLIINGAECEPYITSDDLLMQERGAGIVAGIEIMAQLLKPQRIIIAIEDNKPQAITAMKEAAKQSIIDIIVRAIPTLYPAGGEKQLIEVLTSKKVPSGKIPADIGVVVQNVATSHAIANAVLLDEPIVSRIVTVTGELVDKPGNYEVPIGTSIEQLLIHAQFKPQTQQKIIIGGPMMGFALQQINAPVIKSTNCVIAASINELPDAPPEQNCIRCGDCEQVCPANLLPQQLQWFAKDQDHKKLNDHNLFDCIECGACAFVCPSTIPLVQYYRVAKAEIRQTTEDKRQADRAKDRFEQRNIRLERDKQERLERSKKAAEVRQAAMSKNSDGDAVAAALARIKAKKAATKESSDAPNKDRVAAAIARAKAKKSAQTTSPEPAAQENDDIDPQKARVAAAIARAKAKKAAQQQKIDSSNDQSTNADTIETIDPKKARIAAVIAKAKAKKTLELEQANNNGNDDKSVTVADTIETIDPKKARIAAVIAKAKAKKALEQQQSNNNNDQR